MRLRALLLALLPALLPGLPALAQTALQPKVGEPLPGLTREEVERFRAGEADFKRLFLGEGDGLGPIMNKESCKGCHELGGPGGAGDITVTRFGRRELGVFDPLTDLGGSLLQSAAIDSECLETIPDLANVTAKRITTPIFGAGLIEAIADADLEYLAETRNDVAGRVHWVFPVESSEPRAGRFGWKAQVATLLTFSADAALDEIGLTNRFFPDENAPNGDVELLDRCDDFIDGPDLTSGPDGRDFVDRVTDFQRMLAPPPQTPRSGMSGEIVFNMVGCTSCHASQGFTTTDTDIAALSRVSIKPYSDFLLHNMGKLGDSIEQEDAAGYEMRTAPLWGVRIRTHLLHDGRADEPKLEDRLESAILAHDGEAMEARDSYLLLDGADRDALLAFLGSLGRLEFDHDGDGAIGDSDVDAFIDCYRAGGPYGADDACAISDVDQDGDVDGDDFALFVGAFEGTLADCNANGAADWDEIVLDPDTDCNDNLELDACEPDPDGDGIPAECALFIRGDTTADLTVNLADPIRLLDYLFAEGEAPGCLETCDTNDDGKLSLPDPVLLLNFLFGSGPLTLQLSPYPECGIDDDASDAVGCANPFTCK